MIELLRRAWTFLRQASGDDAYERYLAYRQQARDDSPIPDRAAFVRAEQNRKWRGINRCC